MPGLDEFLSPAFVYAFFDLLEEAKIVFFKIASSSGDSGEILILLPVNERIAGVYCLDLAVQLIVV